MNCTIKKALYPFPSHSSSVCRNIIINIIIILISSSSSMGEVVEAFIRQPQDRPNPQSLTQDDQTIPLIDLACPDIGILAADIGGACKEWGFFQVINHGVPMELRRRMEEAQREFFSMSMEEKKKVRRGAENVIGYYEQEHTKEIRDWKEAFDFMVQQPALAAASLHPDDRRVSHWHNQWPHNPPEMREVCEEYAKYLMELAMTLLGLIVKSLGLAEGKFEEFFIKDHMSCVRMFRYPPCPSPELVLGVGPHKDPGVLTILSQDNVGGLEVRRKPDGKWVRVKPTPNAYIINVGDIIQVWTNDAYESVEHRVKVNSEKERDSMVFFLYPSHNTMVQPLDEVTDEHNPAKYRPYNWGKFLLTRRCSNFKKLCAENIQIDHFKA